MAITVLVRDAHQRESPMTSDAFLQWMRAEQIAPTAAVSMDGGRSYVTATEAGQRLLARGDDALAAVIPTRVESWSAAAGYAALFSALFVGGPISLVAALAAMDTGPTMPVRLGAVAVGLVLGPLPIAVMAELGRRALRGDPTWRGRGRMIFAYVVAALLAAPCLVGLAGIVARPSAPRHSQVVP
ncbi:MAG: hypothetical protein KF764_27740 [Labilithrix sp.]|nr:hypothetical protein [Labilithrix sp.]MBX3218780.1 hypothetical protein [Labilithrix sp.]